MNNILEWKDAQTLEKMWWANYLKKYDTYDKWQDKALQTLKRITEVYSTSKEELDSGTVLEIGCGGLPLLANLNGKEHVGIEPLIQQFPSYPFIEESGTHIIDEPVEEVVLNRTFDVIIMDNVLDHCYNPLKVLKNIYKWSHKNTKIYLGTYIRKIPFRPEMHPNHFQEEDRILLLFKDADLVVRKRAVHSNSNHYYLLERK